MSDNDTGPRRVTDPQETDDAAVAQLLQLAGHRPSVPARDTKIVRIAARAEWLRTVRAQRRRFYLARGGGLLAAAALILWVLNLDRLRSPGPTAGPAMGTVEVTRGQVQAMVTSEWTDLTAGSDLAVGSTIETGGLTADGVASRVALRLADGTSIRLDTNSRVQVLDDHVLALDYGALYADSGLDATADRSLEIRTPLGIATDFGTQFIVRLGDAAQGLSVQVREGEVRLHREDRAPQTVLAGWQLEVLPDGSTVRHELPRSGGPWNWVLEVVPTFATEGRTLHEVLLWASRESGWQLSYAEASLAAKADSTIVHGQAEGLTPEEVAATFLLGSGGMSYRLEDGVLLIEADS